MPKNKDELREAAAKFGNLLGGVFKDALTKSLHAAADAALEEVQTRIEDVGEHVGKVRRRARRAREAPIDAPAEEAVSGRSRRARGRR